MEQDMNKHRNAIAISDWTTLLGEWVFSLCSDASEGCCEGAK